MFRFVERLTRRSPRSPKPPTRTTRKCQAQLELESLEARTVLSPVVHTVADSAADSCESMAASTNDPTMAESHLMKGYEALLAQDHPVDGFYRLEYYFANFSHDYGMAATCYEYAIYNANYWASYDPAIKGSGSDRMYGIWNGMFEAGANFIPQFNGTGAQGYRDFANSMSDAWNTTPIDANITGWWHVSVAGSNGWAYITATSATKVAMYLYDSGSNYLGEVDLDETDGNQDFGVFYHAYDASLMNAISFTYDASDSAHMAGIYTVNGSHTDMTFSRYYA